MAAIERDNPVLKGVLPKEYGHPALDKTRLGQLIGLISNIKVGEGEARAKDVLGCVYKYFLSQFANAEGKKGGEGPARQPLEVRRSASSKMQCLPYWSRS